MERSIAGVPRFNSALEIDIGIICGAMLHVRALFVNHPKLPWVSYIKETRFSIVDYESGMSPIELKELKLGTESSCRTDDLGGRLNHPLSRSIHRPTTPRFPPCARLSHVNTLGSVN